MILYLARLIIKRKAVQGWDVESSLDHRFLNMPCATLAFSYHLRSPAWGIRGSTCVPLLSKLKHMAPKPIRANRNNRTDTRINNSYAHIHTYIHIICLSVRL